MQHDWSRRQQEPQEPLHGERLIAAYDAELDYIFGSLRRLGARSDEMEDLAHDVFVRLLRSRPRLDRRTPFRLHLFGLAVGVLAQRQRDGAVNARKATASPPLGLAALDLVPLKHRGVLILHELDKVPLAEIADSLSMTRIGAALRLRKARRELGVAIRQLAAEWQAGRFGCADLLLAALGTRYQDSPVMSGSPWASRDDASSRPTAGWNTADVEVCSGAREALRLQDDIFLFQMVMDDLPDTIYFKDRESRFTHINRYAAAHYGLVDPARAVGRTDFDFFTDEHAREALRDEQEIVRTGRPLLRVEERETLPDGKSRWVRTTKLPLHGSGGGIVGTFGLSRDIFGDRNAE